MIDGKYGEKVLEAHERPDGCYHATQMEWRVIAASTEADSGEEVVTDEDRAKLGTRTRETQYRFRDFDVASLFAIECGLGEPTRLCDAARGINGWVVKREEPLPKHGVP